MLCWANLVEVTTTKGILYITISDAHLITYIGRLVMGVYLFFCEGIYVCVCDWILENGSKSHM